MIRRTDGVLFTATDDALVVLNLDAGSYHGFNEVGRRIWEMLDEPTSPAQIVARLVSEYDVPTEHCAAQVDLFLAALRDRKLLLDSTADLRV